MRSTLHTSGNSFPVLGKTLSLHVGHRNGQVCEVDFLPDGEIADWPPPPEWADLHARLQGYLRGEPQDFSDVPLDLEALTPFRQQVLRILQSVPYGTVRSYGWLAQACGKPGGSRAVGQALGHNPIPVILPCHRVISANGQLGGFMRSAPEGRDIKTRLLTLEGYLQG